ncbi:MAG: N4-gp56 family major capsid protein [Candidatus Berkelbacteria bacterium]|nr:N4-gp56 family major capsid protein [Candidatus Berkelbacteria bacterium]
MAAGQILTSTLTVTMATYYSKIFLEKARLILRHDAFAQKRGVPANNGKVVNFTRHTQPAVATTGLTELSNPTAVAVSGATVAVTLVEYGSYTNISKFYERTSIDVGLKEQIEAFGINMGESIDTIIRNALVTGGGTAQYTDASTSSTSVASAIDASDIRKATRTLKKNKAIPFQGTQGNPVFGSLVGPEVAYDLLGDTTWQATQQYVNPDPMRRGILGTFFGVEFVETNNNYKPNSSGSGGYVTWIFGKEAYGVVSIDSEDVTSPGAAQLVIKDSGPNDTYNPLSLWSTLGWYAPFNAAVLNSDWIIELYASTA